MLSRSSVIPVVYAAVVSGMVGLLGIGQLQEILKSIGIAHDFGVVTALVIIFMGFAALAGGGEKLFIAVLGALGTLMALTMGQDPLTRYLTLAALLFSIGVYGMTVSRNAVRVLMSIELMLNAININLVAFARYVDADALRGQVFAIFILTVAAAEAAVGLAIVLAIYRSTQTVDMERFDVLKH